MYELTFSDTRPTPILNTRHSRAVTSQSDGGGGVAARAGGRCGSGTREEAAAAPGSVRWRQTGRRRLQGVKLQPSARSTARIACALRAPLCGPPPCATSCQIHTSTAARCARAPATHYTAASPAPPQPLRPPWSVCAGRPCVRRWCARRCVSRWACSGGRARRQCECIAKCCGRG